jgi:[protein-PII] uridylyltransferase
MVLGVESGWENGLDANLSPQAEGEFAASMPLGYRVLFDPRTVRRHAAIALRRGARLAHAEVWSLMRDPGSALCVVAEDRPGLLSAIAAALVFHRIDVITALVFSRPIGSVREAVDLFWVRRADESDHAPIDAAEAASISEVLSAVLSGTFAIEHLVPRPAEPPPPDAPPLVVRFDGEEGNLAILLVEAADRPGILFSIARELFIQGAQIVRSLVRTADGRVFNRFELTELSGGRLGAERRAQIVAAVVAALTWEGATASEA